MDNLAQLGVDEMNVAIARENSRRSEALVKRWLAAKLQAALIDDLKRQDRDHPFKAWITPEPNIVVVDGLLAVDELADEAAEVLVEFLRNPPAMVTGQDGVTRIQPR